MSPRYCAETLCNKQAFEQAVHSISTEGIQRMHARASSSSVPPFLGDLISSVITEVDRETPLRRSYKSDKTPLGIVRTGGSSILPTTNLETAYRVLGHQFPTDFTAGYALIYGSGVSYCKAVDNVLLKREAVEQSVRRQAKQSGIYLGEICELELRDGRLTPCEQMAVVAVDVSKLGQAFEDLQRWDILANRIMVAANWYCGSALFLERIAQPPKGLLDRTRHFAEKLIYRYSSAGDLEKIRELVDHHFDNRSNLSRALLEAQRLGVPISDL
ncbi:MAG: hypothetical protein M1142_01880 [Patescibacteria group bacterium]|nr:hypothetical protein [Patescibacteria group bacterium]